ncbi:hypothetical protein [Pseudomonas synxantha]|uniref:hypothetical protein n=1 Tax=Pseudomonas synxantha TaxID=47883 RepID=UPI0027917E61|nr:hypothetical protein [Pseudomonas synxantha]MDQ0982533.1 hypothetical protein [Pseudomonas synxantha]
MNREQAEPISSKSAALMRWNAMLRDEVALLDKPGAHHKTLLRQAYALHQDQMINNADLSDLLELADSALAFAVESLLDIDGDE